MKRKRPLTLKQLLALSIGIERNRRRKRPR